MAIIKQGDLSINGTVIAYEGNVKIEKGSETRVANPQVNGEIIFTSDISTKRSKVTVTIRVTSESNDTFDGFFANGDNNTITFNDQNFTKCTMEMIPEREDTATVDYVFLGNPQI
jgi:hypothetical protein